jgi:valyl-tRNA synthetase
MTTTTTETPSPTATAPAASSTAYDPKAVEPEIWRFWEEGRFFHADEKSKAEPFTICIPPPNVTGALHMGHALNNTLQDILIRRKRMQGFETLWMPGTDHAGIATQSVVERQIKAREGKTRHDLGRVELVRRIWEWKEQYGGRIIGQLKRMGCSCDWDRLRFTLDERCAKAVRQTFFLLFSMGLIYRGKRLVNWDPALQTAVADDEVDDRTVQGAFHYIRYPLADGSGFVTVGTTRPETMLGDTAVAMNPADPRAASLVGKTCTLPLVNRAIPIIADDYVTLPDPNSADAKARMTTGFLKVTPAHDPNDYEIGKRHALPMVNILNPDGTINENGGKYRGMDRFAACKAVLADLEAAGLLEKIEPYTHSVPHSDRSGSPIEPYLSDQWFVKMEQPAEMAMGAVRDGRVRFHPERYSKTYLDWLGQKRDWCISRQLWWGHRIPVWYSKAKTPGEFQPVAQAMPDGTGCMWDGYADTPVGMICSTEELPAELVERFGLVQDPDVLDTWFSSALWPHSTLGWPDDTPELRKFYPGDVLVTSRDIITLWVARMVMTGLGNMQAVPFRDVVIHAKIMDGFGLTMSKSKGNGVDPVDIIEKYGADGMRFTLASMATETQDIRLPVGYLCPHCEAVTPQEQEHLKPNVLKLRCAACKAEFAIPKPLSEPPAGLKVAVTVSDKFDFGRNFCNKLWNAGRFAMMSLGGGGESASAAAPEGPMRLEDRWILARLDGAVRAADDALEAFRFADAASGLYSFFWDEFCAWYLEAVKPRLKDTADPADRAAAGRVLAFALDRVLRLLHPFTPFVTERMWAMLRSAAPARGLDGRPLGGEAGPLVRAEWPRPDGRALMSDGKAALADFALLQDAIRAVRNIRNKFKIPPGKPVPAAVEAPAAVAGVLNREAALIRTLAAVESFSAGPDTAKPAGSATEVITVEGVGEAQVYVPLGGLIDVAAERDRLSKDREKTAAALAGAEAKLSNEGFTARAKPEVIEKEKARRNELKAKIDALDRNLAELA